MDMPLVEKYRPRHFDDIILSETNVLFFKNVIENNYVPNILLYGPPGTGKTTTLVNLIKSYQEKHNELNKGLLIHLNASDDRGIDTIRYQISSFIHSKSLFTVGTKFIILDEVDAMTRCAQQALNDLIYVNEHVRFGLICNYISKIDESLQSKFIKIKFNKLPSQLILQFLTSISQKENMGYTMDQLKYIQIMFGSDMRSMINYMQINQDFSNVHIIQTDIWEQLYSFMQETKNPESTVCKIYELSRDYNLDVRHIIKDFVYYVYTTHACKNMNEIAFALHAPNLSADHLLHYIIIKLI